jgi:hypothetical protein
VETKIEKLEAAVGKSIEQWNVSDLQKLALKENADAAALLGEPDVAGECLSRSKGNKEVADVIMPLTIQAMLSQGMNEANDILEKLAKGELGDGDLSDVAAKLSDDEKAEAISGCERLLDGTSYQKASAYLLLISIFPDYDVKRHELDVQKAANDIKETICALAVTNLTGCYNLIQRLEELIFSLRARYFGRYQDDIIDDSDGRFEKAMNMINEYELAVQKAFDDYVTNAAKEGKEDDE